MSVVSFCPSVSTGLGWTLVGAASFNNALNDGSDASYATLGPAVGLQTYPASYDFSGVPGNAMIESISLFSRLGMGFDSADDAATIIARATTTGGVTVNSITTNRAWTGAPGVQIFDANSGDISTKSGDGSRFVRDELNPTDFGMTLLCQSSAGDASFFVYQLYVSVTWSPRIGGVL